MRDQREAENDPEKHPQVRRDLCGRADGREHVGGRHEKAAEDDQTELGAPVRFWPETPRWSVVGGSRRVPVRSRAPRCAEAVEARREPICEPVIKAALCEVA